MKIPLFDAHCDTVLEMCHSGADFNENELHIDLKRASTYRYAQFFALFGDTRGYPADTFERLYDMFLRQVAGNKGVVFCRTAGEAVAANENGKAAAFLSVEGAELLKCGIKNLEKAYDLGVRAVTLTWNYENSLSGSSAEGREMGLKPQGMAFVKRCRELGVLIDVSHLSEPGFWDVMSIGGGPVIATHSNSKALCGHARNLTDRQFAALAESGGVAGINLCADFIGERPGVDDVVGHIEHFLALGGERSVGLGADFDGCDRLPVGMRGVEDMEKLYDAMLRKNYSERLVGDIFYNNLMKAVEGVCGI